MLWRLSNKLPWADHDYWLKLPTTKDKNLRTRNGGDFHKKTNKNYKYIMQDIII